MDNKLLQLELNLIKLKKQIEKNDKANWKFFSDLENRYNEQSEKEMQKIKKLENKIEEIKDELLKD